MKKLVTILFVLFIFVGGVFAEGGKYNSDEFKEKIRKFLIKRETFYVKFTNDKKYIYIKKLNPQKSYKDYDVIQVSLPSFAGFKPRYNIVVKGDSLYAMPKDFNKLLVDSDNLATNRKKEKEIIRKFIELYLYNDVEIKK